MDVPNWHAVKMMPLHGVCEPIQLTAVMQIRYITKHKIRKTAGKFYFPLYFNELNSAQEPLEKTDPGSTRGVWREGMVYDNCNVFGLHLTDKQRPKTRRRRDAPTERAATLTVKWPKRPWPVPSPYVVSTGRVCVSSLTIPSRPCLPCPSPPSTAEQPSGSNGQQQPQQTCMSTASHKCRIEMLHLVWPPAFSVDSELAVIIY